MKKYAALGVCVLALAGCSAEVNTGDAETVSQTDLEKQVSGMFTPDNPDATIDAGCDGDLDAKVDATQDCHLTVGDQDADVRVKVTSVDGSDTKLAATPFVPADKVADTIKGSLTDQGYKVTKVDCEEELMGEVGETATCSATPASGDGTIEAKVTSVDGLMVNFNYKVVS